MQSHKFKIEITGLSFDQMAVIDKATRLIKQPRSQWCRELVMAHALATITAAGVSIEQAEAEFKHKSPGQ